MITISPFKVIHAPGSQLWVCDRAVEEPNPRTRYYWVYSAIYEPSLATIVKYGQECLQRYERDYGLTFVMELIKRHQSMQIVDLHDDAEVIAAILKYS
jgi:hypothetical protein